MSTPRHPYPGLRAFERKESRLFFGRREQIADLLTRLKNNHFLAVLGASGSGKSSLMKAGVLPALEKGYMGETVGARWSIAEMRPAAQPFTRLAEGLLDDKLFRAAWQSSHGEAEAVGLLAAELRRGSRSLSDLLQPLALPQGTRLLLLVDQFEELFRFSEQNESAELSSNTAAAFIALLLEASSHPDIYVAITMRSDFLGAAVQFHGLPEAINDGLYLTPRLTRAQLREAICLPALMFDGEIEDALANHLLNEASSSALDQVQPGVSRQEAGNDQLPLLQHALMRLWDNGNGTTLAQYQQLGGLRGALDGHAEEAWFFLTPSEQAVAEILFRALTERNHDGKNTRRPVKVQTVLEMLNPEHWDALFKVIQAFRQSGRNFLMPPPSVALTPDTMLDISHESLMRQWQRLQTWVAAEADKAALYAQLLAAVRSDAELWHGKDLAKAEEWEQTTRPTVAWATRYSKAGDFERVQQFLHQSAEKAQQLEAEKEARRKAELKRVRTQRQWLGAGLLLTTLLMGWAFHERDKAQKAEAASATMQVELVKFTLTSLLAKQQAITDYVQELVKKGQQAMLLDLTKAELDKIYALSKEAKQDWQSKLPTLNLAEQIQLVRLVFAAQPDKESFTALARELRAPPPVVSARVPDMVNIPAGSFIMGCQEGRDSDCGNGEKPAHKVQLAAFELGKYEVTQGQWKAVMGSPPSESNFKTCGDTCPVENVSWNEIQVFIQKLNAQTGKTYRLPSEAEWEYACRAGKDSNYCGSNHLYSVAWYDNNSEGITHPVGRKQANAFGLYDMSGNVWEWVQDAWHDNYQGAPTDGKAWEKDAPVGRVLRGGSWYYFARNTRAAIRNDSAPTDRNYYVGFRLARTPQ